MKKILLALVLLSSPAHAVETISMTLNGQTASFTLPDGSTAQIVAMAKNRYSGGGALTNAQALKAAAQAAIKRLMIDVQDDARTAAQAAVPQAPDPQ